jgi:hypothetical protein
VPEAREAREARETMEAWEASETNQASYQASEGVKVEMEKSSSKTAKINDPLKKIICIDHK